MISESIKEALAARALTASAGNKVGVFWERCNCGQSILFPSFVVELNSIKVQPVPPCSCALQCCEVILAGSQGDSGILKTSVAPGFSRSF